MPRRSTEGLGGSACACESKAGTNSAECGMQVGAGVPELGGEWQFSPGTNAWTHSGFLGLEGLFPAISDRIG